MMNGSKRWCGKGLKKLILRFKYIVEVLWWYGYAISQLKKDNYLYFGKKRYGTHLMMNIFINLQCCFKKNAVKRYFSSSFWAQLPLVLCCCPIVLLQGHNTYFGRWDDPNKVFDWCR